jgi:hypothetical protein
MRVTFLKRLKSFNAAMKWLAQKHHNGQMGPPATSRKSLRDSHWCSTKIAITTGTIAK